MLRQTQQSLVNSTLALVRDVIRLLTATLQVPGVQESAKKAAVQHTSPQMSLRCAVCNGIGQS